MVKFLVDLVSKVIYEGHYWRNPPLRGRTVPVGKVVVVCSRVVRVVSDVVTKVVGEDVVDIILGTARFVISRVRVVWYFGGDVAHPSLPNIPVGFVDGARVTTEWTSIIGNLASRKRLVVHRVFITLGELGAVQAVVAVVVLDTREETVGEIISVRLYEKISATNIVSICQLAYNVTAVKRKGNTLLLDHVEHLAVGALSVSVTHVVQQDSAELSAGASGRGSNKTQHI